MTIYLKQSTASQEIPLGYFLDSVDGNTEETGLTIANTDIKLWKAGATALANKNSGGATHISNGIYYAVLDATDTDTLGSLVIFVHAAGALSVRLECLVLAANIYDSLIGGTDVLQVDVSQWNNTNIASPDTAGYPKVTVKSGTGTGEISLSSGKALLQDNAVTAAVIATGAIDADAIASDAITAAKIAADAIGASELAADAATEIANAVATAASGSPLAVNVTQISGSSTAADNLEEGAESLCPGSVSTGTLGVSKFTTNLTATDDQAYVGLSLKFKGDTATTALRNVAVWVTAYNGSTKAVTVDPSLPVAPADGDLFNIA